MTKVTLMPHRALLAGLGAAALLISGCQDQGVGRPRVFAVDMTGGAKTCTTSTVDLSGGKSADATMTVVNDGGWCAISVSQAGGEAPNTGIFGGRGPGTRRPFAAGLVQTRAKHGELHVHTVGDVTRVDYTPDRGFAGTDQFAVRFLPGNGVLKVEATVTAK